MTKKVAKFYKVFFELRFRDDYGNNDPSNEERDLEFDTAPTFADAKETLECFFAGINEISRDYVSVNVLSIEAVGEAV